MMNKQLAVNMALGIFAAVQIFIDAILIILLVQGRLDLETLAKRIPKRSRVTWQV